MRMYDLINKKKRGGALTDDEIFFATDGFTRGEIPDYQMSALLMAIYFMGMETRETAALTRAMVGTSPVVKANTVDKHSTGGVGDKTTLAVVPIVAACGVPVTKMSGRGLGHTGGTIDKLEAIPGFRTTFSASELDGIVQKHGLCIAGQSSDLAPADKKIYALRDATATVDSIPLIAASIMSKKIAAGADAILLDVKTGNGAFMKSLDDARELARAMVEIGQNCGRKTVGIISDMSVPLGFAIGNTLEIEEVVAMLSGRANCCDRLSTLCEALSAEMLTLAGKGDREECLRLARNAISSGAALNKFEEMVAAQGGDVSFLKSPTRAAHIVPVTSPQDGFIGGFDTEGVGIAAMLLGAGR
ncbi:MAG: thymidine phosphorylase, partial [Defluviitaleaceae bacterium]|nr:thymidine phosphorylase [Defluviitaleaceae bacterium]